MHEPTGASVELLTDLARVNVLPPAAVGHRSLPTTRFPYAGRGRNWAPRPVGLRNGGFLLVWRTGGANWERVEDARGGLAADAGHRPGGLSAGQERGFAGPCLLWRRNRVNSKRPP